MTLGLLIILALAVIAAAGAWHISLLYRALEALLHFVRTNEARIHSLETKPPWLDQELGGADGDDGAH